MVESVSVEDHVPARVLSELTTGSKEDMVSLR